MLNRLNNTSRKTRKEFNGSIKGNMLKCFKYLLVATVPVMVGLVFLGLFLAFRASEVVNYETKPKLVIDHDGGADDAMAIFMALLYEKYFNGPEVIALTTTHGNVDENQVFINTQRILHIADRREVPIYRGSSKALVIDFLSDYYFGFDGLGDNVTETFEPIAAQKEHAALHLIQLSKEHEGNLTVVALASLTNIALAVRLDPDFLSRLKQLYVGAGYIYGDDFKTAEFNAAMDVEAYHIVVESGIADKLTIIPFSQILLDQKINKEWREDVLGSIPTRIMRAQNAFERISFNASTYWCLLDPSAMAVVLVESTIVEETVYSNNSITLCGDLRGTNTNEYITREKANARVIYKVKKEPYKEFLFELFSADLGVIN